MPKSKPWKGNRRKINPKVQEIASWFASAVSDIAYEAEQNDGFTFEKEIKELKKKGVRDIGGALADQLYNDSGTACDLMGDLLCDLVKWDDIKGWNEAVRDLEECLPHLDLSELKR